MTERRKQFNLWFFRDLTPDQRAKLYSIAGLPADEIRSHAHERMALDYILDAIPPSPNPGEGSRG